MSSVLELIKDSMKEIGVLAIGETPSAEESKDCLRALNDLLDSWSTQNLTVFGKVIESFTLQSGKREYTLGSGGDFDTDVPVNVDAVYLRENNSDYPMHMIDNKIWGSLQVKDAISDLPSHIYIENNYPLKKVYVYPTPGAAHQLIFHNWRQLNNFTNITENLSFPKGYRRALVSNLAVEIAPQFGASVSGELLRKAETSLSNIKRANIRPEEVPVDGALLQHNRGFDWRTGI